MIDSLRRSLLLAILTLVATPVLATTPVTEGFLAQKPIPDGSIVTLTPNPGVVAPVTVKTVDNLLGVVAGQNGSFISFSPDVSANVQVATSGTEPTFVSNVNGDIKVGDRITASVIEGVGARAVTSTKIIGIAQASFDAHTAGAQKQSVSDTQGKKHDFYVGQIPVVIGVTNYSVTQKTTPIPPAFQQFANVVAGKQAGLVSVMISFLLLIATFVFAGVVLYSAIRSSIASVGRNPLARGQVTRSLLQVSFLLLLIVGAGAAMIYMILHFA